MALKDLAEFRKLVVALHIDSVIKFALADDHESVVQDHQALLP